MRVTAEMWAADGIIVPEKQSFFGSLKSRIKNSIEQPSETIGSRGVWAGDYHVPAIETPLSVPTQIATVEPAALTTLDETHTNSLWIRSYLLGSIALPSLLTLVQPLLAPYAISLSLGALLGLAAINDRARKIALAIAIIPAALFFIMTLPNPAPSGQLTLFYLMLLALTASYRLVFNPDNSFNLSDIKGVKSLLPTAIIIGQVLGFIAAVVLHSSGVFGSVVPWALAFFIPIFSITEVLLFQGLIQHYASDVLKPMSAALLTALIYAFVGIEVGHLLTFIVMLVVGGVLSGVYLRQRNLILPMLINIAAKLSLIVALGYFAFR